MTSFACRDTVAGKRASIHVYLRQNAEVDCHISASGVKVEDTLNTIIRNWVDPQLKGAEEL